ncbi:MAG: Ig-like domain-containing protein [Anaerolineae bacterium]|nr:Ig-like domain-containing protein [Gloeobacterales cyanobacterium ES-bin-313]
MHWITRWLAVFFLVVGIPADALCQTAPTPTGLQFRLEEGNKKEVESPRPPVQTAPLSVQRVQEILRRFPVLPESKPRLVLPQEPIPRPHTGKTIQQPFPASLGPIASISPFSFGSPRRPRSGGATNQPLKVLRFQPEGDVPLAPNLSVTFSEPMVPVTSQEKLAATKPPIQLSPQPEGQWYWLGTRTLFFEPKDRFPMATEYMVKIPAGTKAANGQVLSQGQTWKFRTPAPSLHAYFPSGIRQALDPVIYLRFDQEVKPEAILSRLQLRSQSKNWPLKLVTAAEAEADPTTYDSKSGDWVAFKSTEKFPKDTEFTVILPPGFYSREGPRSTEEEISFQFRTYGDFQFYSLSCASGSPPCSPGDLKAYFSNPVNAQSFNLSQIQISPDVKDLQTIFSINSLYFRGAFQPDTEYRFTFARDLKDELDQTLGSDKVATIRTAPLAPQLGFGSSQDVFTLYPHSPKSISVYSRGNPKLRVRLRKVTPQDWENFQVSRNNRTSIPIGDEVFNQTISVSQQDILQEIPIDLTPALNKQGFGHVVVIVEIEGDAKKRRINTWVQSTNIALGSYSDRQSVLAWATNLSDGKPLSGVNLRMNSVSEITNQNGIAQFFPGIRSYVLTANYGEDSALLTRAWYFSLQSDSLRWYVFDDRKLYRPGEMVHFKGWVRRLNPKESHLALYNNQQIHYVINSQGSKLTEGNLTTNSLGAFNLNFTLPKAVNLGEATLELNYTFRHNFRIDEFRRPEFSVSASAPPGSFLISQSADLTAKTSYYNGGGLAKVPVTWQVTATQTNYTPPNWDKFTFGTWFPWWQPISNYSDQTTSQTFKSTTDSSGKHNLRIHFDGIQFPRPMRLQANATVQDVNRQAMSSSTFLLVHPASLYVGLRSEKTFVQKGEGFTIESIVTDIDGEVRPNQKVSISFVRTDWEYESGQWKRIGRESQFCTVQSENSPVSCRFTLDAGGMYRVIATIKDNKGRTNETELTLWVPGGATPPKQGVQREEATLIPDRKIYEPGQTAEVLVQSPFPDAKGLLIVDRGGIASQSNFVLDGTSTTLRIPVSEQDFPSINLRIELVGENFRTDDKGQLDKTSPKRPAFASGTLKLYVPPLARTLSVTAKPKQSSVLPGSTTAIDLEVKDASGKPVANSEVAVVVVDESVLDLANYRLENPLPTFYPERSATLQSNDLREQLLIQTPSQVPSDITGAQYFDYADFLPEVEATNTSRARNSEVVFTKEDFVATGAADVDVLTKLASGFFAIDSLGSPSNPIVLRSNFNPLAIFAPSVITDAQGHARVTVKMPDNLTRYRVMAVAVSGSEFYGKGESTLTARLPLMVRPSAPRFLNFGDRFELPVVVQNQTDKPLKVDVALRGTGFLLAKSGQRVTVPAHDRVEVHFPAEANQSGEARFQVAGISGNYQDAAEIVLPVQLPATAEAFATYGQIDAGSIVQPIQTPDKVLKQVGGLEISTSSTGLQTLTDAYLYIASYPYGCVEQISSRIMTTAALRDVLSAFKVEGMPTATEIQGGMERDIQRLASLQNPSGGFGFWRLEDKEWPYLGIHVAHAIQRAKEKGYSVPTQMHERSLQYLRTIESHIPSNYKEDTRQSLIAYALYVRKRLGDSDPERARQLIQKVGLKKLPLESIGWLLPILSADPASKREVAAIRQLLNNRVSETASTAHFVTSYGDGDYLLLNSDRRTDGIILEALIGDQPQSDLIPKIVKGLQAHKLQGHWSNTQENAFILLALDRYFNTYEKVTPDFVARSWLGNQFTGSTNFRGRSTDTYQLNIPMEALMRKSGIQNLTLEKSGAGRLYYRIGLRYAPESLKLKPLERGFSVMRTYESIDDPKDVQREKDGSWTIKAGARVKVHLRMYAPTRRYHVALVDPLPAGLEPINPGLAGSQPDKPPSNPSDNAYRSWYSSHWFEFQNLRDAQAEAFTSLLDGGVYEYNYTARATTLGVFVVPPSKVEEMYQPEVFGRSGTDQVVVK